MSLKMGLMRYSLSTLGLAASAVTALNVTHYPPGKLSQTFQWNDIGRNAC